MFDGRLYVVKLCGGQVMMGIKASALAGSTKGDSLHAASHLIYMLSSVRGVKCRIMLISSKTVTIKEGGLGVATGPSDVHVGRTTTTIKRYDLVCLCSGFFNSCSGAITRVLLGTSSVRRRRGGRGLVGAFGTLLRVNMVPVMGRGSSMDCGRVRSRSHLFNSGSVLSTIITMLYHTGRLIVFSSVSKFCSRSPELCPGTRLVSRVSAVSSDICTLTNNTNSQHKANKVHAGLRTTSLTASRKAGAVIAGKGHPRILCSVMGNKETNALFPKGV